MDEQPSIKHGSRFIGIVEHEPYGWRASFRTRASGEVFFEEGEFKVFATELEATKWLHAKANSLGFSSIEIRRRAD